MLYSASEEQCKNLVNWLNTLMPGVVKFKFEYSKQKIEFLDLEIKIENGRLETNLFVKPTNLQIFLDYFLFFSQHCKEGIIFSQALRVIERCSKPEDVEINLSKLEQKLSERNFPHTLISKNFEEAKKIERKTILKRKPKKKSDDRVRGVFTHNQGNPPIQKWITQSQKLLIKNEKAKKIGEKIQIGWKQPKNLKRIVCGKTQGVPKKSCTFEEKGCWKCGHCRVSCPVLIEGNHFASTNTKKTYQIKQNLNCESEFVIYLGTCQKCKGQYVGKSQTPFKKRHSNHKQEIRKKYGGLGNHYGGDGCGYENLRIQIIDQVEKGNCSLLAKSAPSLYSEWWSCTLPKKGKSLILFKNTLQKILFPYEETINYISFWYQTTIYFSVFVHCQSELTMSCESGRNQSSNML